MHRYFVVLCVIAAWAVTVPATAHAAIRINEIAWMGTHKSATAEWIELANTGTKTVSLAKWTLTASDGSPHIAFPTSAHINAHGYFLLERTRKGTVSGVTADFIYTGGLSNSGETLTLANSSDTTVDVVTSGKDWCLVGGNNITKQTAQRTATGWVTATATPRSVNATTGTVSSCAKGTSGVKKTTKNTSTNSTTETSTATKETASAKTAGATETASATAKTGSVLHGGSPTYEPIPAVYLHIKASTSTVAGAEMKFTALVTNSHGTLYPNASVHFAFGDGSASNSTQVFKNYRAPGTYLVTATAVEGLGSGEDEMTVVVRNASVRILSVSSKGISLRNDSPYRLDLSSWELHAATTTFTFPEGTKMLPKTTVLFPREITHLPYVPSTTALLYPGGKVAVHYDASQATHRVSVVKLRTEAAGCNTIQSGCSAAHRDVHTSAHINDLSVHSTTYENATVIVPAVKAKANAAGTLVDTTNTQSLTAGTAFATATKNTTNTASTVYNKGFLTPWHLSLIVLAIALTIAFVAL